MENRNSKLSYGDLLPKHIHISQNARQRQIVKLRNMVTTKTTESLLHPKPGLYRAPEVVDPLTHEDDRATVWNLGCILFELLTRETLSSIPDHYALFKIVADESFGFKHSLPIEVVTILRRCLQLSPQNRYNSLQELKQALQRVKPKNIDKFNLVSTKPIEQKIQERKVSRKSIVLGSILTIILVCSSVYGLILRNGQSKLKNPPLENITKNDIFIISSGQGMGELIQELTEFPDLVKIKIYILSDTIKKTVNADLIRTPDEQFRVRLKEGLGEKRVNVKIEAFDRDNKIILIARGLYDPSNSSIELFIPPEEKGGKGLNNIIVNSSKISLFLKDAGPEDGDRVGLSLNGKGIKGFEDMVLRDTLIEVPLKLVEGKNIVDIKAIHEGGSKNVSFSLVNNAKPNDLTSSKKIAKEEKETLIIQLQSKQSLLIQPQSKEKLPTQPQFKEKLPIQSQEKVIEPKLKELRQDKPQSAELLFYRGLAKQTAGDNQGAINDYTQAISINPNFAEAYFNRGYAKAFLRDLEGAINDFTQAIGIYPNDPGAYNNRGNVKFELGNKRGAIEDYNEAIRIYPNDPIAYNNRGLAKSDTGDRQGAILDYTQAINISSFTPAYYNRGIMKLELGDRQGAIADFRIARGKNTLAKKDILSVNQIDNSLVQTDYRHKLITQKQPAVTYFLRGLEYHRKYNIREAIENYDQAIRIDPSLADAYNNRGVARYRLGDIKGAIDDYNKAIRISPNFAIAFYNRANANGAIEDYSEAIRINPNFTDAYINRGNAKLRNPQEAIEDYSQAIRINPNSLEAYFNRASAKGNVYEAIEDYSQVIRIDRNYVQAYYHRGNVKSELGRKQEAIVDYSQAISISDKYYNGYYFYYYGYNYYFNRGIAKFELGNREGGIDDFSQARRIYPKYSPIKNKIGQRNIIDSNQNITQSSKNNTNLTEQIAPNISKPKQYEPDYSKPKQYEPNYSKPTQTEPSYR
jgi:tetratricopeptide (TPR) repeat protein